MIITSLQNPKVKYLVTLRERRKRIQAGVFIVEGYEELSLAVETGAQPTELFYCPALFHDEHQAKLLEQLKHTSAQIIEVSEAVFHKVAYRDNPDGWLATFPIRQKSLDALRLGPKPFVVVTESVEKPGNLGAILRTADAAGVDALISCDPTTDWGNPNVVRASKGALFGVQVAEAESQRTIGWLQDQGIKIVAASPDASTRYDQADFSGPVAITVGTEKHGLSNLWLDQADVAVYIPMAGRVNSLNVSTATAILIYEIVRQRQP
jgi:TrmH family RNA methyltransferase